MLSIVELKKISYEKFVGFLNANHSGRIKQATLDWYRDRESFTVPNVMVGAAATMHGSLVGVTALSLMSYGAVKYAITCVEKDWRGKKVGSQLILYRTALMEELYPAYTQCSEVSIANAASIRCLLRAGFNEITAHSKRTVTLLRR